MDWTKGGKEVQVSFVLTGNLVGGGGRKEEGMSKISQEQCWLCGQTAPGQEAALAWANLAQRFPASSVLARAGNSCLHAHGEGELVITLEAPAPGLGTRSFHCTPTREAGGMRHLCECVYVEPSV